MKAILIKTEDHLIEEVDIAEGLQPMYDAIGCDCVTTLQLDDKNTAWLDDEGLLKRNSLFAYKDYPNPLAGNCLILGSDWETGDSVDTTKTVDEIKAAIRFITPKGVKLTPMF